MADALENLKTEGLKLIERPHIEEFIPLQARYAEAVVMRDSMQEMTGQCLAWVAEQTDFAESQFKRAMVLAFWEKIKKVQDGIIAELSKVEPILAEMLARIRQIEKEEPHGERQ